MDSNQEQMETNQGLEAKIGSEIKTIQEKMDNGQEEMKAQVGAPASPTDVNQEMKAMLDAYLEKFKANLGELQSIVVHQEVPKEEAMVEMTGALKDRPQDRHLTVGHCRQIKKQTQGDGGSQKLAASHRGMTHS
jgi:hypothetical protein